MKKLALICTAIFALAGCDDTETNETANYSETPATKASVLIGFSHKKVVQTIEQLEKSGHEVSPVDMSTFILYKKFLVTRDDITSVEECFNTVAHIRKMADYSNSGHFVPFVCLSGDDVVAQGKVNGSGNLSESYVVTSSLKQNKAP